MIPNTVEIDFESQMLFTIWLLGCVMLTNYVQSLLESRQQV